jgi:hypothetical protein
MSHLGNLLENFSMSYKNKLFVSFIFIVVSANSVFAQDWKIEPIVAVGGEYDDNATLNIRTDQEVALTGYLVNMRADINYNTEATSFFIQPRALLRNYPDEASFDSNDLFLRSRFRHRGQSNTFGFRVNFDNQTVRTAERTDSDLEIEDPDEIQDDDTGRVFLAGTRSKWRLSPYWRYRISNISSIGIDIDYFDTRYDDVFAGLLTDYTDTRLNLNYRRAMSSVTTGLLTVTGRDYQALNSSNNIIGLGFLAGFERALSSQTQLKAMIGMENTDPKVAKSQSEIIGNFTLTRNLETIRMFAQYRRSLTASGASNVSLRDIMNLNFSRRLNEKISAGLGIRAYQSSVIGGRQSIDNRKYVQLQTKFVWYLSTSLVIEADYRYTILDRSNALGERANSNRVYLWFVYQPNTIPKI